MGANACVHAWGARAARLEGMTRCMCILYDYNEFTTKPVKASLAVLVVLAPSKAPSAPARVVRALRWSFGPDNVSAIAASAHDLVSKDVGVPPILLPRS